MINNEEKALWEMLGIKAENQENNSEINNKNKAPIFNVDHFADKDSLHEWPPLESIAINLPEVMTLKAEMLPISIRPWLVDVSERMRCPLDYVGVSAIIAIGSIIGTRCGIHPKQLDNWCVVPNLWGVIIGDPSQLKTPATAEILKVFTPLEYEEKEKFKKEISEHNVDNEVNKIEVEGLKKSLKNQEFSKAQIKEQLLELEKNNESSKPLLKRYRVGDITVEKVAELCAENPQGLLVFRDELMGLLKTLEKQGNEQNRAFYLESWAGTSSYTVDRVIKGSFFIDQLCLSLFGGTQPDKIKFYLSEMSNGSNDGLLQRLQLMVYPDPVKMIYIDRKPNRNARNEAYKIFNSLSNISSFEAFGAVSVYDGDIPSLRFKDDAQKLFIEWWDDLHKTLQDDDLSPYLKEHFSKYRSLMPSLALIFHLIDVVEIKDYIPDFDKNVSFESATMAIMWCDYLMSHAKRVYNGLGQTKKQSAIELSKKISTGKIPDQFSVREIQQKSWHLLDSSDTIKAGINELIEAGWISEIQSSFDSKNGRPVSSKYQVNPAARNFYCKQNT